MKKHTLLSLLIALASLPLQMCSPSLPGDAAETGTEAAIYPDYYGVTVPANIAPMNFNIEEEGDEFVVHIHPRNASGMVLSGKEVRIPEGEWHKMLADADGDTIVADIYVRRVDGWHKFAPAKWEVAEEIDPYISYRLIEPSYVSYETMSINQRSLTDFDEHEIYNNRAFADGAAGQCINCHSFQNYNRDGSMQMHIRSNLGGTLIVRDGKVCKVPLKCPATISAGVYPSWHPSLPLIAYSTNITRQAFHSSDRNKIEVYDNDSDLILYDVDGDAITPVAADTTLLESFPNWSPDGTMLYYVCARKPEAGDVADHYTEILYDILRRPFDSGTHTFGNADTVFCASAEGLSATLPRVSPDGRYLLFTAAPYGTFHIWHHDADLWLKDLATDSVRPLAETNSADTESYHSWSSNGRWILFSSRRDDGVFTRLYIAYFDKDGRARKAFLLPQQDPEANLRLFKSYNVPELMVAPVTVSRSDILEAIRETG